MIQFEFINKHERKKERKKDTLGQINALYVYNVKCKLQAVVDE